MKRFRSRIAVAFMGLALADVAKAEDVAVLTGANSARLGGEFKAEFVNDNQGLYKHSGYSPGQVAAFQVTNAYLLLSGYISPDTEYGFRFNLLSAGSSPLEFGSGTHWFTKSFGFSVGKERILQGGWHHLNQGYRTHADGLYARNLAFSDYAAAWGLHLKFQGIVTLQLVNDVVQDPNDVLDTAVANRWNKDQHPAWILAWLGDFGLVKPLLIFGSYDNNRSRYVDVGLRTGLNGFNATLDYHNDRVSYRIPLGSEASRVDQKETDVKTSYTVNLSYELRNLVTPWVFYSYYDRKQASDPVAALSDRSFNLSKEVGSIPGGVGYTWDDNGTVWGLGVDVNVIGKNWNPFIAYTSTSGKFLKDPSATEGEMRSNALVKVGVLGTI